MSTTPGRANPFADVDELPSFEPKTKAAKPVVREHIERIAETNNFPSRQAATAQPRPRVARRWRTGRNQQLNIKATAQTIERFYTLADAKRMPHGELLEQALDALEKAGQGSR
jgi:predicted lipoprotein